jgi:hypothetical protein
MKYKNIDIFLVIVSTLSTANVLWIGYFNSSIGHEYHHVYFVKIMSALTREFVNPFANEGDYVQVDEMEPELRTRFLDYCKYAYGITSEDAQSLMRCREQAIHDVE